jgi:hypothetical protein
MKRSCVCNERIDIQKATLIATNFDEVYRDNNITFKDEYHVEIEDLKQARSIFMSFYNAHMPDGEAEVKYVVAKNLPTGRLYAKNSLQTIPRVFRHTLCHEFYFDLDIENCHPNLIEKLAKAYNIATPHLTEYNQNRDIVINKLIEDKMGSDRDSVKELIISICYGCAESPIWTNWLYGFRNEIHKLLDLVPSVMIDEFNVARSNKRGNAKATALSYRCQVIERQMLEKMKTFLRKNKIRYNVLCHDGLMADKRDIEDINVIASQLSNEIGMNVLPKKMTNIMDLSKYSLKPMNIPQELEIETSDLNVHDTPEYKKLKEEWEKVMYKVEFPPRFYEEQDGQYEECEWTGQDFLTAKWHYRFHVGNTEYIMAKEWMNDPNLRCYKRRVFDPSGTTPHYNTFKGLACNQYEEEYYDEERGQKGLEVFLNLVNEDISYNIEKIAMYILFWIARRIQTPELKNEVVLILKGLGGTGKSLLLKIIRNLIGSNHAFITDKISDLTGNFNDIIEGQLFAGYDDPKDGDKNEKLKGINSLLTMDKANIRGKFKKTQKNVPIYVDMMVTINDQDVMSFDGGGRRYMLITTNPVHSELEDGNQEYWDNVYTYLDPKKPCIHTMIAIRDYLMGLDLTKFRPQNDRVITEEFIRENRKQMPQELRFLKDYIQENKKFVFTGLVAFKDYEKWHDECGYDKKFKLAKHSFYERLDIYSIDRKQVVGRPIPFNTFLLRSTPSNMKTYTTDITLLYNYLVSNRYEISYLKK